MFYRPTSFSKTAFALTTAVALASASVLGAFPANAQQATTGANTSSDCVSFTDPAKGIICEFQESKKREQAAKAQSQAEAVLKKCLVQIADFKKAKPTEFAKLGTITRENACELAAKLPKISASLN
jgi:hypothetical protein